MRAQKKGRIGTVLKLTLMVLVFALLNSIFSMGEEGKATNLKASSKHPKPNSKLLSYSLLVYLPLKGRTYHPLTAYKVMIYIKDSKRKYDFISRDKLMTSLLILGGDKYVIDHISQRYLKLERKTKIYGMINSAYSQGLSGAKEFTLPDDTRYKITKVSLRSYQGGIPHLKSLRAERVKVSAYGEIEKPENKTPVIWGKFYLQSDWGCSKEEPLPTVSFDDLVGYLLLYGANVEGRYIISENKELKPEFQKRFAFFRIAPIVPPSIVIAYLSSYISKQRGEKCLLARAIFQAPLQKPTFEFIKQFSPPKSKVLGVIAFFINLDDYREIALPDRTFQIPSGYQKL